MEAEVFVEAAADPGGLVAGAAFARGRRHGFEDAHVLRCAPSPSAPYSLFIVADGHGGTVAATWAASALPVLLEKRLTRVDLDDQASVCAALRHALLEADAQLLQRAGQASAEVAHHGGATVNLALVTSHKIYCANAGDSRCLLVTSGGRPVPLSTDHKPTTEAEAARVEAAGSFVSDRGRIGDRLSVSRGLGDFAFKDEALPPQRQAVTAMPDVVCHRRNKDDEFLVLACDGLWDVLPNKTVAAIVSGRRGQALRARVAGQMHGASGGGGSGVGGVRSGGRSSHTKEEHSIVDPQLLAATLVAAALEGGTRDNVTAVVVALPGAARGGQVVLAATVANGITPPAMTVSVPAVDVEAGVGVVPAAAEEGGASSSGGSSGGGAGGPVLVTAGNDAFEMRLTPHAGHH